MRVKFIEASNSFNWGKFLLLRHGAAERSYRSRLPDAEGAPIVMGRKFGPQETFVIDLQTGEGAAFVLGGGEREARYQLNECHRIWVCPLFEPFLVWLHEQPGLERAAPATCAPSLTLWTSPSRSRRCTVAAALAGAWSSPHFTKSRAGPGTASFTGTARPSTGNPRETITAKPSP